MTLTLFHRRMIRHLRDSLLFIFAVSALAVGCAAYVNLDGGESPDARVNLVDSGSRADGSGDADARGGVDSRADTDVGPGNDAGRAVTCTGAYFVRDDDWVHAGTCAVTVGGGTALCRYSEFLALGCTVVTGQLTLAATTRTSFDDLVVTRTGGLAVAGNSRLTSVGGLERIEHVGGNLTIAGNTRLASLGPLLAWAPDTVAGTLAVFGNDVLPQCEVDAFDAWLTACCSASRSGNDDSAVCP